jgi:hypothetical protein
MKGNLILPLINGVCGVSYRKKKKKKKTILQWNCAEDLLLAGYIILFWNKFRN